MKRFPILKIAMNPSKFYLSDPWLDPFKWAIEDRIYKCQTREHHLAGNGKLVEFAMGHYYYGLHCENGEWIFREWAPNANNIFLVGVFSGWKETPLYKLNRI